MSKRYRMNVMRPVLIWFTFLALPAACVVAQNKTATPFAQTDESIGALKAAYRNGCETLSTEIEAAYEHAKKKARKRDSSMTSPIPRGFSARFLAVAAKNPDGPDAVDALKMTLLTSEDRCGTVLETRAKAIRILQDYYASSQAITGFLKILAI